MLRDTRWHYKPVAQLLTVMPKESLDKYVYNRFVFVSLNSKSTETTLSKPTRVQLPAHPLSYQLVPFSKRFRWECPVRLPFVDDERMLQMQRTLVAGSGR